MNFAAEGNDSCSVKEKTTIRYIANLLSCTGEEVEKALISRVVAARGEVVHKGHTVKQAEIAKDAFAKVGTKSHCMFCHNLTLDSLPGPSINSCLLKSTQVNPSRFYFLSRKDPSQEYKV